MSEVQNDIPDYRSCSDAELGRQLREETPGITDADVADTVARLRRAGVVVSSVPKAADETSKLFILQKGRPGASRTRWPT